MLARPGSWKSVATVAAFLGITCAALYPVAVVPLMSERRDVKLAAPGFKKGSMWREIDRS